MLGRWQEVLLPISGQLRGIKVAENLIERRKIIRVLEGIQEIREIRNKAVNNALVAFAVLMVPAVIASLARAVEIGWQNIFYFHMVPLWAVWPSLQCWLTTPMHVTTTGPNPRHLHRAKVTFRPRPSTAFS